MVSEMCTRASGRFWIGLIVSVLLVVLIPIGAVVAAKEVVRINVEQRTEQYKRDKPKIIDRAAGAVLAYAVLSWKVQHNALPTAEAGKTMLENVVRSFQARPVKGEDEESDMFEGVKVLGYAQLPKGGFSITLAWPEAPGQRTFVFDEHGNSVDGKEASNA